MSEVKGTTKKKMAVSADQFEDADEETDFSDSNMEPDTQKANGSKVATSDPPVGSVKDDPVSSSPKEEAGEVTASVLPGKTPQRPDEEEPAAEKVEEEAKPVSVSPHPASISSRPTSTSPTTSANGANPLDALASACIAEEQLKVTEAKASKEGMRVKADEISCTDVLCGRGGQSNHHPGNIFFRRLVRVKQEEYLKANKREKTVVAKDIVKLIRLLSPPGRFLKKDPKDESVYVDVGDIQARNKASQALREGAPELREELRDQHSRLNAQNGGASGVKLPYDGSGLKQNYQGSGRVPIAPDERGEDERGAIGQKEREELAAARGLMLPSAYGMPGVEGLAAAAALRGQTDPPDGSDEEVDAPRSTVSAAAMHAAAEERARRLMLAGAPPGLGGHFLNPHLGLGGLGAMNPYLAGHSPAVAAQLQAAAALQAAGGSHLLSPQAMMMGGPSAAALLQATRARELAHFEAASYAAATGINPLLLGGQQRAHAPFQDSMRLHELMSASGNGGSKREREEIEREIDENYSKASKLGRKYL